MERRESGNGSVYEMPYIVESPFYPSFHNRQTFIYSVIVDAVAICTNNL